VPVGWQAAVAYDILDTAFLLRWNELVAAGHRPEELPPLRPHRPLPTHRTGDRTD